MKEIKFKDTIQFGIWKFLDHANGTVQPHFACVQPVLAGALLGDGHQNIQSIGDCGVGVVIGCEGATSQITLGRISGGGLHRVFVNDVEIDESPSFFGDGVGRNLQQILKEDFNVDVIGLDENQSITTDENYIEIARFQNNSANYVQLRIGYIDADFITDQYPPLNPTLSLLGDVSFCLAPV